MTTTEDSEDNAASKAILASNEDEANEKTLIAYANNNQLEMEENQNSTESVLIHHNDQIATANIVLESSGIPSPVTNRQDYRLDFTEVEGTLEAVPEEATASIAPHTIPNIIPDSDPPPITTSTPMGLNCATANFNIAESVASEFSDCSFHNLHNEGRFASYMSPPFIKSSEPLSAKQQVALWLTRTSMTDVSSMPSLRSLIFSSFSQRSSSNKRQRCYNHDDTVSQGKSCRKKSEIHRNFSTKSLINGYGLSKSENMNHSPILMRKCETMMALSGSSSMRSTGHSLPNNKVRSKRSSLNLFKKLTRHGGAGASHGSSFNGNRNQGSFKLQQGPSFSAVSDAYGESVGESPYRGFRPVNRLRSTSSIMCSHCASVISFNNSRMTSRATSQMSLFHMTSISIRRASTSANFPDDTGITCKICMADVPTKETAKLTECGCTFCKECMNQYISLEINEGAYDISCPDPDCDKQGVLQHDEIEVIVGKDLMDRHKNFRLNTEVALDKNRAWCPRADCQTICHVCDTSSELNFKVRDIGVPVKCPTCSKEFCSLCSANWHPDKTCQQNGQDLVNRNNISGLEPFINFEKFDGSIKACPMCRIPIEREAGCAQMMCKRCKHVFCWFCLASLNDDFLLRHYDSGECKGLLGHSRASVIMHRAQVIGIFTGLGILLLLISPILLITAPCILCCKCGKLLEKLEAESNSKFNRVPNMEDGF